jgi:hypothetical protein
MKNFILIKFCALSFILLFFSCKNEIKDNNKPCDSIIEEIEDLMIQDSSYIGLLSDYEILDLIKGDLNQDRFEDMIIVYNKINQNIEDERVLAIYFAYGQGYELHAISSNAIGSKTCGGFFGDCYNGIDIKDGYFSVNYYGGSGNHKWLVNSTFKYDRVEDCFFLTRVAEAGSKTYAVEMDHKEADSFVTAEQFGTVSFQDYDFSFDYFAEYNHIKK